MTIFEPRRRRPWVPTTLPPGPPIQWRPNWGNAQTNGLAFLFLPATTGYYDVVRGDIMSLHGTTTSADTPFGRGWVLGVTGGSVSGYATTAGGNKYYASSPASMTLMCGLYNPATITLVPSSIMARWSDNSSQTSGNAIFSQLGDVSGVPRMAANVVVAGANSDAIASGGAGITMNTNGQGMTFCSTYNGATIGAYYSSTALGFGSATAAKTGTPSGIDRVVLSDTATQTANRCVLWAAGWFNVLTLAQITAMVATNGGLPSGLLRRK